MRQRLLLEAQSLPRDVRELTGAQGHVASLESSTRGDARIVRVSHDGIEVCWTFSLGAGEARPDFYPPHLPFIGADTALLGWDVETGLWVMWTMPGTTERVRELAERVRGSDLSAVPKEITELTEKLREATPDERKELFAALKVEKGSPVLDWTRQIFGDPPSDPLSRDANARMDEIVLFHEQDGWHIVEAGAGTGASRRVEMRKGAARRRLQAISVVGLTTIQLSERPEEVHGSLPSTE